MSDVEGFVLSPLSLLGKIVAFENGEMDECEQIDFLTELRDSGLLFQLQGSYGRAAQALGVI